VQSVPRRCCHARCNCRSELNLESVQAVDREGSPCRRVRPQQDIRAQSYSLQPICSAILYSRCHRWRSCLSHSKFGSNSSFLTFATCLWQAEPGLLWFVFQLESIFSPLHSANAVVTVAIAIAETKTTLAMYICIIDLALVFLAVLEKINSSETDSTVGRGTLQAVGAGWLDPWEWVPKLFPSRSAVCSSYLKVCIQQRSPRCLC